MAKLKRTASQRLIRYQQGLSIVEVMASATLLAVIAVGAASFVPSAFRANKGARDLTASTQVMNGVMEILNTIDFSNITPYPFTTEPIYTSSNQVAVIDTTTRNADSPVTVCLERATGSTTACASGKTMNFPYKYSLNKMDYRVDLVVYKGKHAYLVDLPTALLDRFALASLPGLLLERGVLSLSELLVPPAEAAGSKAGSGSSCTATPVTTVEAGLPANFTATNTIPSTPDVRWTFQDTPAITSTDTAAPFQATKIWTIPGTYSVQVFAWKNSNNTSGPQCSGSPFTVTVTPPAPVNFLVFPGLNSFVGVPFSFSVDGTICPTCTSANTTWEMPGCTPATGTGLSASCSYATAGSYTVLLKRNGATVGTKSISIGTSTVNITAPTATSHAAGQTISFAATCSNCGSSPIFDWTFGDGNNQLNSQTASHSYANPGAYTPQVTVRDGSITPNPPTIGYATLPLTIISGTSVSLDVTPALGVAGPLGNPSTTLFTFSPSSTGFSGSPNNPTNAPVTYDIWYGDGNATNQAPDESQQDTNPTDTSFPQFTHKYTDCGVHTATVKATVGSTTHTATQSVNTDAQATISASATSIQAGDSVTFSGATLGNGATGSYSWTFNDDNSTQTGQTVSKTFSNPGTYTVTLNVTGGCNPSATSQITVLADSNTVAANQSYMKKIIVKVAPWSVTPPSERDYLGSAVFFKANND